jgi:DNA-directed RNA polymerase specialized sigma24 family protein
MEITEEVNNKVFRRTNTAMKGDMWADDIAQDVVIDLWRYVDVDANESLLKMMIKQKITDYTRNRLPEYEDIEEFVDLVDEQETHLFDLLREKFDNIRLKVKLSRKQRGVLALVLHGVSYSKACKMVGVHDYEYYKMVDKFREVLEND